MKRSLLTVLLVPLALIGCAADTTPDEGNDGAALQRVENIDETRSELTTRVPFCLPGEVRKCTLGPPPVCHCELPPRPPVFAGY